MNAMANRPRRRPNMRRAVILFPSGLTLGNLFFGVFAIVAASRLEFTAAGVYVLLGGICDALDGRVARVTNAGTQFGEELDSLVDAITFGLAPGMIMYFAVLNRTGWDWIWVFLFCACAVMRLARFNIEQAGTAKTYFQGLPSPAAGITLASFYWFSQSTLYTYGAIADLKWHVLLRYLMVVLSFLMISNVPYPSFPRTGFRSLRALAASLLVIGSVVLLMTRKLEYFFPFALIYVAWGLARWVFSGLFERRQPTIPYDLSEGEDDEDDEDEDEDFELSSQVHAERQGHRAEEPARVRPPRESSERTERPERGQKKPRPDRPPRAAEQTARPPRDDGAPDADRSARRDKKRERPKRGERPAGRATAATTTTAATETAVTGGTGAEASTVARDGGPEPREIRQPRGPRDADGADRTDRTDGADSINDTDDADFSGGPELFVDEPDESSTSPGEPAAGAPVNAGDGAPPPRKRKRRRRRGERKDRPAAEPASDGEAPAPSSPYAAEPITPRDPAVPPPIPRHLLPPPVEPSE